MVKGLEAAGLASASYCAELSSLRRRLLEGEWDACRAYRECLEGDPNAQRAFDHQLAKYRFLELLCHDAAGAGPAAAPAPTAQIVEVLEELQRFCRKDEYETYVELLSLPSLQEEPSYADWTVPRGRALCFRQLCVVLKPRFASHPVAPRNRLETLLRQALSWQLHCLGAAAECQTLFHDVGSAQAQVQAQTQAGESPAREERSPSFGDAPRGETSYLIEAGGAGEVRTPSYETIDLSRIMSEAQAAPAPSPPPSRGSRSAKSSPKTHEATRRIASRLDQDPTDVRKRSLSASSPRGSAAAAEEAAPAGPPPPGGGADALPTTVENVVRGFKSREVYAGAAAPLGWVPTTILQDSQPIRALAFDPAGARLALGCNRGRALSILRVAGVGAAATARPVDLEARWEGFHRGSIYCVDWDATGALVATGSNDADVRIAAAPGGDGPAAGGGVVATLEGHDGCVRDVAFSQDACKLASCGEGDNAARVWDVAGGRELLQLPGAASAQTAVKFAADDGLLYSLCKSQVDVWDLRSGGLARSLGRLRDGPAQLSGMDLNADESLACVSFNDGVIKHVDVRTGDILADSYHHTADCRSVRFSPSGEWVLSCAFDATVFITDASRGTIVNSCVGHQSKVVQARWNPAALAFATCSVDNTCRLWTPLAKGPAA